MSFCQTKQAVVATNGAVYYAPTQPAPLNNIPIDQFSAAAAGVYPPAAVPAIYPQTIPYQPYYQYYSVPMVSVLPYPLVLSLGCS